MLWISSLSSGSLLFSWVALLNWFTRFRILGPWSLRFLSSRFKGFNDNELL